MPYHPHSRVSPRGLKAAIPLARLTVIALVVLIPAVILLNTAPPVHAGSCAEDTSNILKNGTMAPGSPNSYGVVAASWNAFVLSSNVPHFENASNEGWDPNGSQYIWSDYGPFDAGIFQTVNTLQAGQVYHFWIAWGQTLVDTGGGNNLHTNGIGRQIGVDLTGGTNPTASTVQWTVPYTGSSGFLRVEWNLYFKATGSTATFFLRSINYLTSGRDKVFFDTACVYSAPGSPTTTPWATSAATASPAPSASPTATRTQTPTPSPSPTQTPVPPSSPTPSATTQGSANVAPTPADPSVIWDSRLPGLNVSLVPASVPNGTLYWKLIRADFNDTSQHCGDFSADHDMYYVITNEQGGRVASQHVWQSWPDGQTDTYSDTRGIADIAIWSNYDPAHGPGPYSGYVADLPSDIVSGMGLPLNQHVSFILYFQKTIASAYPTRTATPGGSWNSPTPSPTPTLACTVSATITSTPVGGPTSTPRPTATNTPTLTNTPIATPVNSPTITPTRTPTPNVTATPGACAVKSLATIPVGAHPKGVAVDPATNRIFVGLSDSSSVAVVDANSLQLIATWPTDGQGNSNGVAFALNKLFITKRNNAKVSVVDATSGSFIQNITVGNAPYGITASGSRLWVANFNDGTLALLDASTNTRLSTVTVGTYPSLLAPLNNHAYLTTFGTGTTDVDNNNTVLHSIPTGDGSFGVAVNPLTNSVFISNRNTKVLSLINATSDTVTFTFTESAAPYALAFNPTTNHGFIVLADSNTLRVRDGASGKLVTDVPIGAQGADGGDSIAVLNNNVYVANNSAGTLSVIGDCAP